MPDIPGSNGGSTTKMVERGVGVVVALTVAGIIAAFLLPVAINEIAGINLSQKSWSSGAESLWGILDLIFVLVLFLTVIGWAVQAYR